jgi:ribonuclease Z
MEERERPGRFNPGRAVNLGVPKGPFWGRLQDGMEIVLEDGKTIRPDQVLGPARCGRNLAYVVDTRPVKALYRLCRKVDIVFIEAMFLPEDADHAGAKGHLTVVEAAGIAKRAEVKKAVLVHISPRYGDQDLARLESKALETFEKAVVGRDLAMYSIAYQED